MIVGVILGHYIHICFAIFVLEFKQWLLFADCVYSARIGDLFSLKTIWADFIVFIKVIWKFICHSQSGGASNILFLLTSQAMIFIDLIAKLDEFVMLFVDVVVWHLGFFDEARTKATNHLFAYALHENTKFIIIVKWYFIRYSVLVKS